MKMKMMLTLKIIDSLRLSGLGSMRLKRYWDENERNDIRTITAGMEKGRRSKPAISPFVDDDKERGRAEHDCQGHEIFAGIWLC
jgi:hypothetical protein